ncbi:putative Protein-tyrosine-phosphatase [Rhodotorula taiwanensis]|uniref:diphosphoinositol-polyphosphate diphosphatase n=1 Tax=Rhodotorula taiwanensis TaxID=741276 RepID=A0A2S5B1X7_9BASI|nr:putative Protein-tyrosine-phosphatase [Rhodotorula taiwanensis]
MDSVRERRVTDGGAVTGDSSSVAARPAEDQLRDSTTSHAGRIPQWMLMLMHDRGSLDYPERSRSRRRHARPEVSSEPAAPSEVDIISASRPGPQPAQGTVPIGAEALEQDGGSSGVAEQCPPFEAPFPTGDGPGEDPPRSAYRDSYGDFSSASSTTSSSTSFSGFDSRSVSSVTSASSATTFSAAGWNGQAGSPSASASSFGDRKRSPAGFISREHSAHGLHSLHHVRKDGAGDSGAGPGSPTDTLGDATLCLSKLSLPVTADLRAPDESDSTPLASTSLLEAPSPPRQNALAESDETAATLVPSTPTPAPHEDGTFLAPQNFATVSANLFRSSFPRKEHFPFLKNLGLKSVMVLVQEPYPEENADFLREEGIQLFQFGIPGNKEPFVSIPDDKVVAALTTIIDKRNHPMLIHCNKGKHRTGCVIGCLRRCQSWSLTSIFDEYRRYSTPKSRAMDLQFIEAFAGLPDVWRLCNRDQLPRWPTLEPPPLPTPADPPSQPP